MYCKTCHYNLRSTSKGQCPECGRAFRRYDAATFDLSTKRLYGPVAWITMVFSSIPMVLALSMVVTWCIAALALGHWPVPYIDDPKYINNGFVTFFYTVTMSLMIATPFTILVTIVLLIVMSKGIADVPRRVRCFLMVLIIAVVNLVLAYIVIGYLLPSELGQWLMD